MLSRQPLTTCWPRRPATRDKTIHQGGRIEKTRTQLRLAKRVQEQERLKQETAKARAQHRQQLKTQKTTHATQLGQLMRASGFEDITIEAAERWLKMALNATPLTVLDGTADLPRVELQPEGNEM